MGTMQTIGRGHTKVTTECGTTTVRYHDTDVVIFDAETITLNTGGWKSVTTKARMNQTANQYDLGFYVYQEDSNWFIRAKAGVISFTGRTVTLDRKTMRTVNNPEEWEAEQ